MKNHIVASLAAVLLLTAAPPTMAAPWTGGLRAPQLSTQEPIILVQGEESDVSRERREEREEEFKKKKRAKQEEKARKKAEGRDKKAKREEEEPRPREEEAGDEQETGEKQRAKEERRREREANREEAERERAQERQRARETERQQEERQRAREQQAIEREEAAQERIREERRQERQRAREEQLEAEREQAEEREQEQMQRAREERRAAEEEQRAAESDRVDRQRRREQRQAEQEQAERERQAEGEPRREREEPAAAREPRATDEERARRREQRREERRRARREQEELSRRQPVQELPENDRAAQRNARPDRLESATAERGTRREGPRERRDEERQDGGDVLRTIGDRLLVELGNQVLVESDERPRLRRNAREVYYEDLPRGRTRETIVRANGVRVVTVRDRFGDVIRRSRFTPDGREQVLVYAEERGREERRAWRDPGEDLPPLRINVPREEYVLESEGAQDSDEYYEFLERPPVEAVERLYSIGDVKRSARVREMTRRVDLDSITFAFGSAEVPASQVSKLDGVAVAMERMLERNPAETFLVEGHTDAVGSDLANLALSDRRAEAVAQALTDVFAIPPENLTTQGYGEEYLKVDTDGPEGENRRVAIRRITALVAPVASAE